MKKLKNKKLVKALSFIAAVVILVLIICLGETDNNKYSDQPSTEDTGTSLIDPDTKPTDSIIPTIDTDTKPDITYDPVELGKNVTVTINPVIEGAEIDRDPFVNSSHPEYIESYIGGGSFSSSEGKVYKNDRVWTVDIQNNTTGEWMTFSFGLAHGEYNRFLYLNPSRVSSNPDTKGYFRFKSSNGTLLDLSKRYENRKEMLAHHDNFSIRRAMDQLSVAEYTSPMYPGTAWYTNAALEDPVYVDVICYLGQGSIAAILRLWIDKDDNGCYYLAALENQDLYLQGDPIFTTAELYHIYEMADVDILDTELTGFRVTDGDWNVEDYFFDYREKGSGPYYDYFLPTGKQAADESKNYRGYDILAVTLRYNGVTQSITLYYRIITMPYDNQHGVYQYLGRDYSYNASIDTLQGSGYPGFD